MIKKLALVFSMAVISVCTQAQSFSAPYTFGSVTIASGITDPTPVPTATGVTFGSFTASGVSTNSTASGRFSFKTWSLGATNGSDVYANLTGALDTSKYYEVTVSPNAGYKLTLTSIKFKVLRSTTGIRTYAVRSSADGYTTNLPVSISPANTKLSVQAGGIFFWNLDATITEQAGSNVILVGPDFTNIVSPVTFRYYGWNAESTAGTFSIDNDTIFGSASAAPTASFLANTSCFGTATQFSDFSTSGAGGVITNWIWDFGDGSAFATTPNPSHLFTSGGTKNVKLVVKDNLLNSDSISETVFVDSVNAFLSKSILANVVTFTGGASNGIPPYQTTINFGDGAFSANPNNSHTYTSNGPYTACLTVLDSNGCTDSSCISFIIGTTGVNSFMTNSLSIYPNPSANGIFTVNLGGSSFKTIVTVYTVIGEVVFSKEINSGSKQTVDLSNEPSGCYFMNIKNDKESNTKKITINK